MASLETLLAAVGAEIDRRLAPHACQLVPGSPCRIDLDVEAFGEPDHGRTFTVDGVTFWFYALALAGKQPPGAALIDGESAAHATAIATVINRATRYGVEAYDDDGKVHLFGPFGVVVTSDCPGVVVVPVDPGAAPVCT